MRPRLLDLFCGAGGAAMGYHRAGFDVVGVDINPQPHYPFEFHQGDAMEWLRRLAVHEHQWESGEYPIGSYFCGVCGINVNDLRDPAVDGLRFDAIHASPPCQGYSPHVSSRSSQWVPTLGKDEPRLIHTVRELAQATGLPYVIENVYGARGEMEWPVLVCGTTCGLRIHRHRLFEGPGLVGSGCIRLTSARDYADSKGWDYRDMRVTGKGRRAGTSARWKEIMGIDWHMTQHEIKEAIPPVYTEFIGAQLLAALKVSA